MAVVGPVGAGKVNSFVIFLMVVTGILIAVKLTPMHAEGTTCIEW